MNQPNLFSYATSELSQDAFICWLLSWASPELKGSDKDLHECAIKLIEALFNKHKKSIPSHIKQVEVRKQDNNIDVLCIINNKYPILIEDKTGTKDHSNQLTRYLEDVKNKGFENEKNKDFKNENIIPIYFKTGDQASYSSVKGNGYKPFLRDDFLHILNSYNGSNAILLDYRGHLQSISDKVKNYKSKKISDWDYYDWTGFYLELQKQLGSGEWDYVPNQKGGFLGFWWHFQGTDNCKQYLQLEQDKFCFKIWVKNKNDRILLRSKWHQIINDEAKNKGTIDLVKPSKFGNGEYMTVCVFDGEYRKVDDGVIDMGKTIDLLKKAEDLF